MKYLFILYTILKHTCKYGYIFHINAFPRFQFQYMYLRSLNIHNSLESPPENLMFIETKKLFARPNSAQNTKKKWN